METHQEIVYCKKCRTDYEMTEEIATGICPYCLFSTRSVNTGKKLLDLALEKMTLTDLKDKTKN